MDLGGVKLDKTKTNMYLVYYLSHVMLLSKD